MVWKAAHLAKLFYSLNWLNIKSWISNAGQRCGSSSNLSALSQKIKSNTTLYLLLQTADIDASILTDHMMLQATELGLGSVWICYFKPGVIRREFDLPDELEPINTLAIGYADGEAADPERHAQTRIPLEELVSYETR